MKEPDIGPFAGRGPVGSAQDFWQNHSCVKCRAVIGESHVVVASRTGLSGAEVAEPWIAADPVPLITGGVRELAVGKNRDIVEGGIAAQLGERPETTRLSVSIGLMP